jgi:hypothetical protein
MSRTSDLLRRCRDELLRQGPCSVEDVIRLANRRYGEVLREERDRLLELALRREVKGLMREATGDGEEDEADDRIALLPGLEAPRAVAVPTDAGDYRYVPFELATWDDLQKARQVRVSNVSRATERLRDFDQKLEALRPYMEGTNNMTVAAACELMARAAA